MSSKFHFEHHRRESIVNKRRFSVLSAVLVATLLSGVGIAIKQYSSANAAIYVDITQVGTSCAGTYGYNSNCSTNVNQQTYTFYVTYHNKGTRSTSTARIEAFLPNSIVLQTVTNPTDLASRGILKSYGRIGNHPYWDLNLIPGSGEYAGNYTFSFTAQVQISAGSSASWNGSMHAPIPPASGQGFPSGTITDTVSAPPPPPTPTTAPPPSTPPSPTPTPYRYPSPTPYPTSYPTPYPTPYRAPSATPTQTTPTQTTPKPATPAPTAVVSQPRVGVPKPLVQAPKPGVATQGPSGSNAPADNTAPTAPSGFTVAILEGGNDLILSWQASTDSSGINTYNLERSADNSNWESLGAIKEVTFDDKTVDFGKHYFYRLTATDNAGNTSGYALADATTSNYQENTGSNDSHIDSDDGIASVFIPSDAITSGADCSVIKGDAHIKLIKGQVVIAGPYQLLCKDIDGNRVASFTKAIKWTYQFKDQLKRYGNPSAITFDDSNKTTPAKYVYNKKTKALSFTQASGTQTIVLASKTKGVPVNLIIGILFVLGIIAAIFFFVLRRKQQENYSDYIRSKYYDI